MSPFPVHRPQGFSRFAVPSPQDLLAEAQLGARAKLGYVVADAQTGTVLETMNPLLALPPASVAKAVTAMYGIDALGGAWQFRTRLLATGPIAGGRLKGDLILAGGGDPVLDTNALAELAARLKAAGVSAVEGRFRVYGQALPFQHVIDASQPDHLGYNPTISGLNLNFNRVHFQWQRAGGAYDVQMDARSDRYRPKVSIARMRVVERDLPVYTYAQDGVRDNWTVAKSALGEAGSRWLPVRRPDLYAGEVFQALARAQGIRLGAAEPLHDLPEAREIAGHDSASLQLIARLMLKYSTNLTAEVIGLAASQARGGAPETLRESAGQMSTWMQTSLGAKHADLHDHSGLSDASRLSASDMVRALVRLGPDGTLPGLMKEITPLGVDGKPNEGARHAIRAKTGSLNFVSSLAGYVSTPAGRPLAFAVFSGDLPRRAEISRSNRERPDGARGWGRRARKLQHRLIARWAQAYEAEV